MAYTPISVTEGDLFCLAAHVFSFVGCERVVAVQSFVGAADMFSSTSGCSLSPRILSLLITRQNVEPIPVELLTPASVAYFRLSLYMLGRIPEDCIREYRRQSKPSSVATQSKMYQN